MPIHDVGSLLSTWHRMLEYFPTEKGKRGRDRNLVLLSNVEKTMAKSYEKQGTFKMKSN